MPGGGGGTTVVDGRVGAPAGGPFPWPQSGVRPGPPAIESRLYAEDPALGFLPSIGEIALYAPAAGPGVRVDDGIESGSAVSPYYDPMLAKIIAWGQDRGEAIRKLDRALREMVVLGVTTNIPYLRAILAQPAFVAGHTSTNFLAEHLPEWSPPAEMSAAEWVAAAAWEELGRTTDDGRPPTAAGGEVVYDPWGSLAGWRNVGL